MGLKKLKSYKGYPEQEMFYDIIEWRVVFKAAIEASEEVEAEEETWRIIIKVVLYSDINKIEVLEPAYEYYVGDEPNKALITHNKVIELAQQHEEFIGAVEV